jgi:hypothetical protein
VTFGCEKKVVVVDSVSIKCQPKFLVDQTLGHARLALRYFEGILAWPKVICNRPKATRMWCICFVSTIGVA